MSTDETVYVLPNGRGGTKPLLHTDPDCSALIGPREPKPKPRAAFRGRDVCARCSGQEIDHASTDPGRSAEGKFQDQHALEVIRSADGPLSRRDFEFEAHVSSDQALRALRSLRDQDLIEAVPDDDDGRRLLYRARERERPAERR